MRHGTDPLARISSLPHAILLGAAASAIGMTFLKWIGELIARTPIPPGPVWVEFMAIRAAAGAVAGTGMYAATRLPHGWLRRCLLCTSFFLLIEGDIPDFTSRPRGHFFLVWAGASLASGLLVGTVLHLLARRYPARPAP